MYTISESGITLSFPDQHFFRFEACNGYRNIQQDFKEMDVCWYQQTNDTLFIIELKGWKYNSLVEESDPSYSEADIKKIKSNISKHRIDELTKKSIDSVSMFLAILLETPYAVNIQSCAPFKITNATKIKLITIVDWTDTDTNYISTIHSAYKTKFGSYAKLFGITTFVVLTKEQARNRFEWVV